MALPIYTTPGQRIWHYCYMAFCVFVLFFLVAPLVAVIPLSFTATPFLNFTPEMLSLDPDAFSVRWYKALFGMCDGVDDSASTMCHNKWMTGAGRSLYYALISTVMPAKRAIMALMISPLIVPLIITAAGMAFFFAKVNLSNTDAGIILAYTILGMPFVVITVTSTLVGFDRSLMRAGANLGGTPTYNFFKIQMPLIAPGMISGALFAFITAFDEIVIILFIGGPQQHTLPRQMWSGIPGIVLGIAANHARTVAPA
jgi:putative spermidine/putrescine transport system permease protein